MRVLFLLASSYLVLSSGQAAAAPSAYSSGFGTLDLVNETSSTLVRDSDDPSLIWVLPPSSGQKAYVSSFQANQNLDFCDNVSSLSKASNSLAKRIATIAEGFGEIDLEVKLAEENAERQKVIVAEFSAMPELSKLITIEDQVADLKSRREDLLQKLDTCVEDLCYKVKDEFQEVRALLREKEAYLYELAKANVELSKQYNRANAKLKVYESIYDDSLRKKQELLSQVIEVESLIMGLYASKAKLEGGYAGIDFDSMWDANVKALSKAYPSYEFRPIQTKNTRIFANVVGPSKNYDYYESLPALLDYSIAGQAYLPAGEIPDLGSDHALPSKISGALRLSILGACPLEKKDFFKDVNLAQKTSTVPFSISASFSYPLLYSYKLKVKYNLYKVYEIIKRSGTKGGLFSSKSYRELIEKTNMDDALTFDWDDQAQAYTKDEKLEIQREIKKSFVDKTLAAMAEPVKGKGAGEALAIGPAPEAGAIVIADGLTKVCGFHIYCHAGSWILRGVYGVFGRSEIEDRFKQSHDIELTEEWSSKDVKYVPATVVF